LKAEIIMVGSELISGDKYDINGPYLAGSLAAIGIDVFRITTVGDKKRAIEGALRSGCAEAETGLIIVTGGLGPTKDDITTDAAAAFTGYPLIVHDEALKHVRSLVKCRDKESLHAHERQALIPRTAELLKNHLGTAYGYILRHEDKILAFMPGEPKEMMDMAERELIPSLKDRGLAGSAPGTKSFHVFGLSEVAIESLITAPLEEFECLKTAYLPSLLEVTVRLSSRAGDGGGIMEQATAVIRRALNDSVFAEDDITMEQAVGNLLRKRGMTLALAESCTGGLIGHRITNVSGSSDYFLMGLVVYSNEAKTRFLEVEPSLLKEYGAVSSEVAARMAEGAREAAGASIGLAVTGIAGPAGGSRDKPVGTVFIALASDAGNRCKGFRFRGSREDIKALTAQNALDLLRRALIGL